jgi:hypothetical protein
MHLYPNGWGEDNPWALQWIKDHIRHASSHEKRLAFGRVIS